MPQCLYSICLHGIKHTNYFTKDHLSECLSLLICNTSGRVLSPEALISGPWTCFACQAHATFANNPSVAGSDSWQETQDLGYLPCARCPNLLTSLLIAVTLPAIPAAPEHCGTYSFQFSFPVHTSSPSRQTMDHIHLCRGGGSHTAAY